MRRPIMLCVALPCLISASPSFAEETAKGALLWGDLQEGMTRDEVKAIQPATKIAISDQCAANLSYVYQSRRLKAVTMTASIYNQPECRDVMLKSMSAKYGENPTSSTDFTQGDCGYGKWGDLCRLAGGEATVKHTYFRWVIIQTRIDLEITDKDTGWTITYSAEPQAAEGARTIF